MRRLAKQDRKDTYASRRDYQDIRSSAGVRFTWDRAAKSQSFEVHLSTVVTGGLADFVGGGGYVCPQKSERCVVTLASEDGSECTLTLDLQAKWSRFGVVLESSTDNLKILTLKFEGKSDFIDLWGADIADVQIDGITEPVSEDIKTQIRGIHLMPETMFVDHVEATTKLSGRLTGIGKFSNTPPEISVKKCSYCQRLLPIDRERPSALSFHKHNAKKSGHQNECRACKKWRINNTFNPLRTIDQLHESSVITRERKILLRDSEILQKIKDREGDGLKSIVWKKFGKKCFNCQKSIPLSEVQLDHTRPLAYLWPIDEYATCLCAECNNHKSDRFPCDFYSNDQLTELSKFIGLPVSDLNQKSICQEELDRIVADIVTFSETWDPRTFNAIARKVSEIQPETDLFKILEDASEDAFARIQEQLGERPNPVPE